MGRAVDVRSELEAVFCDFGLERKSLKSAGVGEKWMGPVHELVDATQFGDIFGSRAKIEMVIVGQNYLGT